MHRSSDSYLVDDAALAARRTKDSCGPDEPLHPIVSFADGDGVLGTVPILGERDLALQLLRIAISLSDAPEVVFVFEGYYLDLRMSEHTGESLASRYARRDPAVCEVVHAMSLNVDGDVRGRSQLFVTHNGRVEWLSTVPLEEGDSLAMEAGGAFVDAMRRGMNRRRDRPFPALPIDMIEALILGLTVS